MPYPTCRHVKQDGNLCQSPAMKGRGYCYYHADVRARRMAMAQARARGEQWWLRLPALEDMRAVQSAIAQVVEAVAADLIPLKRARVLLTGLRLAANNFKATNAWHEHSAYENDGFYPHVVSYSTLEQDYGLPADIDLDADPDTIFPPPDEQFSANSATSNALTGLRHSAARHNNGSGDQPRANSGSSRAPQSKPDSGLDVDFPRDRSAKSVPTKKAPQPETAPGLIDDDDLDKEEIVRKARTLARKAVVHLKRTGTIPARDFEERKKVTEDKKAPASDRAAVATGQSPSTTAQGTA